MDYDFNSLPKKTLRVPPALWLALVLLPFAVFTAGYLHVAAYMRYTIAGSLMMSLSLGLYPIIFIRLLWLRRSGGRRFGKANNLTETNLTSLPIVLGQIAGDSQRITNSYEVRVGERLFTTYDYSITATKVMARYQKKFSGVHFTTVAQFPHIFLDGRRNHLGYAAYNTGQKIQLEGNFNEYFDVYLPDGQQVDVLSVITPDIMQQLMTAGRRFDIEINGHDVHICSQQAIYTRDGLPSALSFAAHLFDELNHRAVTWTNPAVAPPKLRQTVWRNPYVSWAFTIGLMAAVVALIVFIGTAPLIFRG